MSRSVLKLCLLITLLVPLSVLLEYEKTFLLQEDIVYSSSVAAYEGSLLYDTATDIAQISVETGKLERTFRGHANEVFSIVVLNKTLMLSLCEDKKLVLWDLETGSILKRYQVDFDFLSNVQVALIENMILLGNFDGVVRKIDLKTDKITVLARSGGATNCVLQYQDYVFVCSSNSPFLIKINPKTGTAVPNPVRPAVPLYGALIFENSIFTSGSDARVLQWNVETGRAIREFNTEGKNAYALHVNEGNLYSVNEDYSIVRWSIQTGARHLFTGLSALLNIWPLAFSRSLMFLGIDRGVIVGYDSISGEPKAELKVPEKRLSSVAIWKSFIISAGLASRIYAWSKETFDIDPAFVLDTQTSEILCIHIYDDTLFSGGKSTRVHQWSLPDLQMLKILEGHNSSVKSLVAGGGFLYTAGDDKNILQWNITTGSISFEFEDHSGFVNRLRLYDNLLFSTGNYQTVRSWNATSLEASSVFNFSSNVNDVLLLSFGMYHVSTMEYLVDSKEMIRCTSLATDGTRIYAACDDSKIKVREPINLDFIDELRGHEDQATSICFDENNILYSTGYDGTIKRWNITDTSVSYSFADKRRRVNSIAADKGVLYMGLRTGTVESYDTSNALILGQSSIHSKTVSSLTIVNDKLYSAGLDGRIVEYPTQDITQSNVLYQNTSTSIYGLAFTETHLNFISGQYEIKALGLSENMNAMSVLTSLDPLICLAATESVIFAGSKFGTIYAWRFSNSSLLFELTGHSMAVNDLLIVDSNLYSASDEGSIVEWFIVSGEYLRIFERTPFSNLGHIGPVLSLAVCNGALFSGGSDATTRKWNLTSTTHEDIFFGPTKAVTAVRCNNLTLFSGSDDFAVYMYRFAIDQAPAYTERFATTSKTSQATMNIPIVNNDFNRGETSPLLYIVLAFSICLVVATLFFFRSKIWKRNPVRNNVGEEESTQDTGLTATDLKTFVNTSIGISKHAALELPPESVAASKKLAAGGGGEVFLAKLMNPALAKKHGEVVIQKQVFVKNKFEEDAFFQEVGIMVMLSTFPHFCQIIGYTLTPFAMILKFYSDGSLSDWVKNKPVNLSTILRFSSEIAQGLNTMHSHFLAHCDIKSQNILIETRDLKPSCYITDFGITQVLSQTTLASNLFSVINLRGLSVQYAAPEAFRNYRTKNYSEVDFKKYDIYSFACVIYEALGRKFPWS